MTTETHSLSAIAEFSGAPNRGGVQGRKIRLAWVSTWNSACGIAEYSRFLLTHFDPRRFSVRVFADHSNPLGPDGPIVLRCWDQTPVFDIRPLADALTAHAPDAVMFQCHRGFFHYAALGGLVERLAQQGIVVFVCFHAIDEADLTAHLSPARIQETFGRAARILVHAPADLAKLGRLDLDHKGAYFAQGVGSRQPMEAARVKEALGLAARTPLIGTYGFLNPDKGFEELVAALPLLQETHPAAALLLVTAMLPRPASQETARRVRNQIERLGLGSSVTLVDAYLSDEQSMLLLEACDFIVFPRKETDEASSASVRMALATLRPVLVTPIRIFDELAEVAEYLPGPKPHQIAAGILHLAEDVGRREHLLQRQQEWLARHTWRMQAERLQTMLLEQLKTAGPAQGDPA
jgi:glycosyltransferase involved in cell wall biosynthesis